MNKYISEKLTFFSFWLIILVVLLHAANIEASASININTITESFLSLHIAQVAVPFFLMISGYLFFLNVNNCHPKITSFFLSKISKRVRTLIFPYVFWCVLWFAFMWLLQALPYIRHFFPHPLQSLSLKYQLYNLLVYPLNYPFWFLRELILYIAVSPLIYYLIKYTRLIALLGLLVLNMYFQSVINTEIQLFHLSPLLFFSIGSYLAIFNKSPAYKASASTAYIMVLAWVALNLYITYIDISHVTVNHAALQLVNNLKNLLGCIGLWQLYDHIKQGDYKNMPHYYKYSFFVFAFHGIPILLLKNVATKVSFHSPLVNLITYFVVFFITIIISVVSANIIKRQKGFYDFITGGR